MILSINQSNKQTNKNLSLKPTISNYPMDFASEFQNPQNAYSLFPPSLQINTHSPLSLQTPNIPHLIFSLLLLILSNAWPFHQPLYGPQTPPLVSPNNDVGMDGLVINLAALLAGTATNPFGNGFYQGPKEAPLEAASACTGIFAKGSYPGFPGELLVDSVSGGSYNANGRNGRKYLLPALFDPSTSACSTLV